jgi:hypothetical protein
MKKLLFLLPVFLFSFDFKHQFLLKNYDKVCKTGIKNLYNIKHSENLLSLIGIACAKSDNILYLPIFAKRLKKTKESRNNAIYFSVLFLQKKLLYAYFMDNIDISYYEFPMTDHPISIVTYFIAKNRFKKENGVINIEYKNKTYKVYKDGTKVFVLVYENGKLKETHWYR